MLSGKDTHHKPPINAFSILYNVNSFIERCESTFNKCNKLHDDEMHKGGMPEDTPSTHFTLVHFTMDFFIMSYELRVMSYELRVMS